MKTMLDSMLIIVANAFVGKFDRGGNPYVLHCLTVMHKLRTNDQELMCIALGHDLFEDTYVTALELEKAGISRRVIDGIEAMTKRNNESYDEYKAKVKKNKDSILVKMADLQHNSDIRRLKGVREKDIQRTIKYHEFYLELKEIVEAGFDHKDHKCKHHWYDGGRNSTISYSKCIKCGLTHYE